jgi:hypothetical protein
MIEYIEPYTHERRAINAALVVEIREARFGERGLTWGLSQGPTSEGGLVKNYRQSNAAIAGVFTFLTALYLAIRPIAFHRGQDPIDPKGPIITAVIGVLLALGLGRWVHRTCETLGEKTSKVINRIMLLMLTI